MTVLGPMCHVTKSGSLNVDTFVLAIMAHRNTRDPVTGLSPAEVLYGRKLRDAFRFALDADRNSRSKMSPMWREAWELKERANRHRFYCQRQATNAHARDVKELAATQLLPRQTRRQRTRFCIFWQFSGYEGSPKGP